MSVFRILATVGILLALVVIVLGAWVRLTDAGLGCPDWPGCYGAMVVPESPVAIKSANEAWPEQPLERGKAWREMIHRYAAGLLGFLILAMAVIAVRRRDEPGQPAVLPLILIGEVSLQTLLGMWTVTLLLKPIVVTAHLLGGMATLGLLAWLALGPTRKLRNRLSSYATVALAVLSLQIALGGWTSANYAGLGCPDFPTCQNELWPDMNFSQGFVLWRELGVNYEGGLLGNAARTAIHMAHRLGAMLSSIILLTILRVASRFWENSFPLQLHRDTSSQRVSG